MYKIIVHNIFAAANIITIKLFLLIVIINTNRAIWNIDNNINNKAKINFRVEFLIWINCWSWSDVEIYNGKFQTMLVFKRYGSFLKLFMKLPTFLNFFRGRIQRIWAAALISDAAQIWMVPLKIAFNVSRFKPALNWNRFLADLRRGSNSLNSGSEKIFF